VRYGVTLPPFYEWSDPRVVMEMAREADDAGWDGFFVWDHVTWDPAWGGTPPIADPWLCLAAAATVTSRVLLGPMVTPLVRRRPQQVAREIVTLDQLSGGRAVLGVGLGADYDFTAYGEPLVNRGARLDEALAVLTAMLTGETVDFEGEHYTIHSPPSLPPPVNGRVPIWMGGFLPNAAPFARAARYDGVVPNKQGPLTPDDIVATREMVGRTDDYDYVASGNTASPSDSLAEWEDAGATWWLESLYPFGGRAEPTRQRVKAGPPRS
jgi:alkanesulfonate monooxygenase SsuD/methylene tetrahydromethanopterin reductase-like flavin-dependent oxidoreductase (luciferase family)